MQSTGIPTRSEANGLHLENKLYFASHTNIFAVEDNHFGIFTGVEGTIKCFSIYGNRSLVCTKEHRLYLNYGSDTFASMAKDVSAIDSCASYFVIGSLNVLEVWEIPDEYGFTQFRRIYRGLGHTKPIIQIRIISDDEVITSSMDGTVRIFNWKDKTTRVIAKSGSTPINISFNDNKIVIVYEEGRVVSCDYKEKQTNVVMINTELKIICAAFYNELIAVICQPSNETNSSLIILYKNNEEIYKREIDKHINEVALHDGLLALKGNEFVSLFSILSGTFNFSIDLPKITNFTVNQKRQITACCDDGRIRIYNSHSCQLVLHDPKASAPLLDAHSSSKSCIATYTNGYVSVFNIRGGNCYRSFLARNPTTLNQKNEFMFSSINDESDILFLANSSTILIIDLKSSRVVDSVGTFSQLISLDFHRGFLYFADLSSHITKLNPFTGSSSIIKLSHTPSAVSVSQSTFAVATSNEILIYDLNLNFRSSFNITLDGRHREEVFSRGKEVETMGINSTSIMCGGRSNQVKLVGVSSEQKRPWNHEVLQVLQLSRHSDWENYKKRLGREKDSKFDRTKFIEARRIKSMDGMHFVLSREGIHIFEPILNKFGPIEIGVEVSEQFIKSAMDSSRYAEAITSALLLGEFEWIRNILPGLEKPREVVRVIPKRLLRILLECAVRVVHEDRHALGAVDTIKWLAIEHGLVEPAHEDVLKQAMHSEYAELSETVYLLRSICSNNE